MDTEEKRVVSWKSAFTCFGFLQIPVKTVCLEEEYSVKFCLDAFPALPPHRKSTI